jgi:photosynthetic reaction center cytochrome c subunit
MKVIPRNFWKFISTLGIFILLAIIAFSIRSSYAQTQAPLPGPSASQPAEAVFKNIQVLKGVPSDQIQPAMQFITASLGAQCSFCHVQGHFDSDDKKPKLAARHMMTMMFAINKDNFGGHTAVTCNTCHRGNVRPMGVPEITEAAMMPRSEAPEGEQAAANGPSADQILAKYVAALGGADAINKVTSRVQTGTAAFGGYNTPIDIYSKAPEMRVSIMKMPNAESTTAYNGTSGWLVSTGHPLHEMNSADLEAAKMDADLHFATNISKQFPDWRVLPNEKVGDHDAVVIRGRKPGEPPLKLYFDPQSGLLVRLVRYAETPLGNNPTQIDYADYRDVDGVKVPFKWTVARPGNSFTIQIDKTQQNVPVDDAKFAKPNAPAQP